MKSDITEIRNTVGLARWRYKRTTTRELQTLNDHYLADIGLDRTQTTSIFKEMIETGGYPV